MIRLSHTLLRRMFGVLRECHEVLDTEVLQVRAPEALAALIPADRVSLNEIRRDGQGQKVVPWPRPAYWTELGDICRRHMAEHPLWRFDAERAGRCCLQFSEYFGDRAWMHSTVYREYYLPTGARHQLGGFAVAEAVPGYWVGFGFNRWERGFSEEEVTMCDLLMPQIGLAWRHARTLSRLRDRVAEVPGGERLTAREAEVLHWMGEGKRNDEIGVILGISGRTVGKHVEHVLEKLGVETRTAAVRFAGCPAAAREAANGERTLLSCRR